MRSGHLPSPNPFGREQIGSRTLHVSGADRGFSDVAGVITDSRTGCNHSVLESGARGAGLGKPRRGSPAPRKFVALQLPRTAPMAAVTSSIDAMPSTVFSSPVEA